VNTNSFLAVRVCNIRCELQFFSTVTLLASLCTCTLFEPSSLLYKQTPVLTVTILSGIGRTDLDKNV